MKHKKLTRRDFLRTNAAIGAIPLSLGSSITFASDAPKPDILLIMPDQMRGDCMSGLAHPVVRTPYLDALAAEGTLFRRAYTPVASCIPARYALLTGLYPQTSGVVGFRAKPFSTPSLPGLLSKAGYDTVLVGRNMHQVSASGSCGYQKRILGSTYVDGDEYDQFLRKAAPESGGIRKLVKDNGLTYNHWQANPWPLSKDLHPTAWAVSESRKVISGTEPDKPLFLTSSYYAPHPPLFPPKKYYNSYMEKDLPPRAKGDWVDWDSLSPEGNKNGHRILLEGEALRKAQSGYYGLIEHIDSEIASLIADFKARSETAGRSWLIVFTSDHGEMMGDHGYFRKCEPFEGSANIPFIIAGSPELGFESGQRCHQPVTLEDIMPTLLNYAGVYLPDCVDGINLAPVLQGDKFTIRDWLHFEHAPCYSQEQAYHALTDGNEKYIWRPKDGREFLFDLNADPREEHDLSRDSASAEKLKKWRSLLIKRLANRPEGFSDGEKLIPGQPYRPLNKGNL